MANSVVLCYMNASGEMAGEVERVGLKFPRGEARKIKFFLLLVEIVNFL